MIKPELTPVQERLVNFFSPVEIPTITKDFKLIFRVAAFETENEIDKESKNALFSLYHLIELLELQPEK